MSDLIDRLKSDSAIEKYTAVLLDMDLLDDAAAHIEKLEQENKRLTKEVFVLKTEYAQQRQENKRLADKGCKVSKVLGLNTGNRDAVELLQIKSISLSLDGLIIEVFK